MEFLKTLYANTKIKTACWTIVNCLIVIAIVGIGDLSAVWVAPLVAGLNFATKWINLNYLTR